MFSKLRGSSNDDTEKKKSKETSALSAKSRAFIPESNLQDFEPQSSSVDAEVDSEIDECMNAIMKDKMSRMDYKAAAVRSIRASGLNSTHQEFRTRRERSREQEECPEEHRVDQSERGGLDGDESNEREAAKSFGKRRMREFYRTKERRDGARRRHMDEIARRSGRHPNHRNVLSTKAHRLDSKRRHGDRGGRQGFQASILELQGLGQ